MPGSAGVSGLPGTRAPRPRLRAATASPVWQMDRWTDGHCHQQDPAKLVWRQWTWSREAAAPGRRRALSAGTLGAQGPCWLSWCAILTSPLWQWGGCWLGIPELLVLNCTWDSVVQELGCVPGSLRMAMASASGCRGEQGITAPSPGPAIEQ